MSHIPGTPAEKREALFMALYKQTFPAVAKYICKRGGTLEEARDVFQDAVISYYEKIALHAFHPENGDKAYLMGIAKHLWFRKQGQRPQHESLDEQMDWELPPDEREISPATEKISGFLARAGQKCMELLQAFYYHRMPMDEIASTFGFSGTRSATVQKYKCLEKVRNEVQKKSLLYEDFLT